MQMVLSGIVIFVPVHLITFAHQNWCSKPSRGTPLVDYYARTLRSTVQIAPQLSRRILEGISSITSLGF